MTRRSRAALTAGHRTPARVLLATAASLALVAGLGVQSAGAVSFRGTPGTELVVTGTVERVTVDDFASPVAGEDELTYVDTASGSVQVPTSALEHVTAGATVRVGLADSASAAVSARGVEPLTVTSSPSDPQPEGGAAVTSVQVVAAPTATTEAALPAQHQVTVVVVTPSNGTVSSVTAADVAATINGPVDAYWSDATGGLVGFAATAWPTVVTTATTPCSATNGLSGTWAFWDEVAAKIGWTEAPGKHLLVYFKKIDACNGVAGLGSVGADRFDGGVLWSNGYNTTGVLGHELGHNLSLGHSQLLDCTASGVRVLDAPAASCAKRSYADSNDIMAISWQNQGYLNGSHLRDLRVLPAGAEVEPASNGVVTLSPLASGTGTRVLTLASGADRYVLELRQPVGQDAWMASWPGWGTVGVSVRREFDQATYSSTFPQRESYLLDGQPSTTDPGYGNLDDALPVGVWLDLAGGDLGVRVTSMSATSAVVEYRIGPASNDLRYVAPPLPIVSTPVMSLRAGAVSVSSGTVVVPVGWNWKVTTPATDPAAAATVTTNGLVSRGLAGASTWTTSAYRAAASALDGSVVTARGSALGRYRGEGLSTYARYSSGWASLKATGAVGGAVRSTKVKGATVSVTAAGRSLGVLLQRGSRNGYVAIYVDGIRVAVVNLKSRTTGTSLVYVKNFGTVGTHRVVIKNLTGGTYGRLGFDGSVVLV